MTIINWIIWGTACLIALAQLPLMKHKDDGVKILATRFFVLLFIGVIITFVTPVSKLHLLWWIPTAYLINAFAFNYFASRALKPLRNETSMPCFGNQISWNEAYKKVFTIVGFDRNDSIIDDNGRVTAKSNLQPYGYLIVESPVLSQVTQLPIIHKDDFLLADSIYGDEKWKYLINDLEFLVTYYPKTITSEGLASTPYHVLHFVITPLTTISTFYKNKAERVTDEKLESLFKQFVWEGEVRVQMNL